MYGRLGHMAPLPSVQCCIMRNHGPNGAAYYYMTHRGCLCYPCPKQPGGLDDLVPHTQAPHEGGMKAFYPPTACWCVPVVPLPSVQLSIMSEMLASDCTLASPSEYDTASMIRSPCSCAGAVPLTGGVTHRTRLSLPGINGGR
jgi:hypothetical protein